VNLKPFIAPIAALILIVPLGVQAAPSPRSNWLKEATRTTPQTRFRQRRNSFDMNATTLTNSAIQALAGGNGNYSEIINFATNSLNRRSYRSSNSVLSPGLLFQIFNAVSK
jgi:hypothetical protein